MPRPTSKPELLDASAASFEKLMALVASLSPEQLEAEFAFEDRDRNVRDVLIHLHEWHRLLIEWVEANLVDNAQPFLPEGYTWDDLAPLNVEIRDKHANTSVEDAVEMVQASRAQVRELIQDRSDPELFEKHQYPWTGDTSLGEYCVSVTSGHDDWAMKKLHDHARG
jgi:hypothetical protein